MTVVQPNSIAGINSISVQSGQSLSIHKSDGTLIREIVASTGISTYSSISVGSATTTNNANKSINIGLGASISQHADNSLSFGTNGDERLRITSDDVASFGNSSPPAWQTGGGYYNIQLGNAGYFRADTDASSNFLSYGANAYRDSSGWKFVENGRATQVSHGTGTGAFTFYTSNSGNADNAITFTEALRIDVDGNSVSKVGIGTDSIAGKLEVYNGASKINALTLRTGAGANGYTGLAFASNQTYSREKAAIYFQETSGGAHHAGDIVIAVDSAGGDAGQVATSDEKVRITSAGNFLVGKNSVYGSAIAQVHNTSQYVLDLNVWSADANPAVLAFYKSRNATPGGATVVQDDDGIGSLRFLGNDGANSREAAYIKAFVDGAPGTNDMPGRLVFGTTADGGSSSTERVTITSAGNVDINGTPPWSVSGGDYRTLSISGQTASSSGFLALGNGAAASNADFDVARIRMCNGGTEVAQIAGSTHTSATDDGRLSFWTKSTSQTLAERIRIQGTGQILYSAASGDNTITSKRTNAAGSNGNYFFHVKATNDGNDEVGSLGFHRDTATDDARIVFNTRNTGGSSTERLRISSTGLMTQTGQTRISQSSTHSHGLNAGTVLEARGDAIGSGVVDVDFFKGLKIALNDSTEWGGQAQFSVGRWEENGNNARSSFVLSLAHGQINSSTNADVDVFTCHSNGRMYVGHTGNNAGSNGRFYVTSSGASESTCDLHHSTNDNSNCLNLIHGGAGVNGNPTRVMVEFRNFANNAIATIQSNSTTITYNTGSDYRMKENQVDISDGITKVKQLKPYRFNWKSEYGGGDKVDGFFAHEAATVVPEAVQGTKDAVDSNGDIIRQQIDHSKLVPLLTAALKEAIAKIETLETKVAALESS